MKQNYEKIKQLRRSLRVDKKLKPQQQQQQTQPQQYRRGDDVELSMSSRTSMSSQPDLGLIEILVYFCYRFCLITSRLAVLALICYLFQHWLFIALASHILLTYLSSFACLNRSSTNSRLHQQLTLFIACLLSFVDLFANQLTELSNFRKIVAYYILYLAQNVAVCTYWLVRTIFDAAILPTESLPEIGLNSTTTRTPQQPVLLKPSSSLNHTNLIRSSLSSSSLSSSSSSFSPVSPTTTVCYATLVYLCIILFTMFGLILKFLHLHILRKRCRRVV